MEDKFTQTDEVFLEELLRNAKNQNMKNYYIKNKERIIARQTAYNKKRLEEFKQLKNNKTEIK